MTLPSVTFSHDQAEAFDRIAEALRADGVDLEDGTVRPPGSGKGQVLAVIQPAIQLPLAQYRPPNTRMLKISGTMTYGRSSRVRASCRLRLR